MITQTADRLALEIIATMDDYLDNLSIVSCTLSRVIGVAAEMHPGVLECITHHLQISRPELFSEKA